MAALEEKVIASWKYQKGALDPKTAHKVDFYTR